MKATGANFLCVACLLATALCAAVASNAIANEGVLARFGLEAGGFVDYTPIELLPPQSSFIIQLWSQ